MIDSCNRKYLRDCLKTADTCERATEQLARAQLHLGRVLEKLDVSKNAAEIKKLTEGARELLKSFLKLPRPEYLRGDVDELAVFDNFQVTFNGRFTGRLLLGYIQEHHKRNTG